MYATGCGCRWREAWGVGRVGCGEGGPLNVATTATTIQFNASLKSAPFWPDFVLFYFIFIFVVIIFCCCLLYNFIVDRVLI